MESIVISEKGRVRYGDARYGREGEREREFCEMVGRLLRDR